MYEIPANQDRVIIIPNKDNADFIYMDTEYSFGTITDETRGELKFASLKEGAVTSEASFKIFETDPVPTSIQSVKINQDIVTVTVAGAQVSGTVVAAVYDSNGKMLFIGTAVLNGNNTYSIKLNTSGSKTISVFLLDDDQKPICEKISKTL